MKNKRGQFYLVAAFFIIVIVYSLVNVNTYAISKPKQITIQGIGTELKQEGYKVVDYGIYNDKNIFEALDDFAADKFKQYFLRRTSNANIIFLYGNLSDMHSVKYENSRTGKVTASLSSTTTSTWYTYSDFAKLIEFSPDIASGKVTVNIHGKDYDFKLNNNQMFYFVIVEDDNGEVFVEKT